MACCQPDPPHGGAAGLEVTVCQNQEQHEGGTPTRIESCLLEETAHLRGLLAQVPDQEVRILDLTMQARSEKRTHGPGRMVSRSASSAAMTGHWVSSAWRSLTPTPAIGLAHLGTGFEPGVPTLSSWPAASWRVSGPGLCRAEAHRDLVRPPRRGPGRPDYQRWRRSGRAQGCAAIRAFPAGAAEGTRRGRGRRPGEMAGDWV